MAFRIQDLMMDVRPGGGDRACPGYQMANPECTCQITVKPGGAPAPRPGNDPGGKPPGKDPGRPGDKPPGKDKAVPSRECPPARGALAADLAALREQLRQGLTAC